MEDKGLNNTIIAENDQKWQKYRYTTCLTIFKIIFNIILALNLKFVYYNGSYSEDKIRDSVAFWSRDCPKRAKIREIQTTTWAGLEEILVK